MSYCPCLCVLPLYWHSLLLLPHVSLIFFSVFLIFIFFILLSLLYFIIFLSFIYSNFPVIDYYLLLLCFLVFFIIPPDSFYCPYYLLLSFSLLSFLSTASVFQVIIFHYVFLPQCSIIFSHHYLCYFSLSLIFHFSLFIIPFKYSSL